MGTKVQSKSYLPGYYSMKDLNEDHSSCSRPLFYGNRAMPRNTHYDSFPPSPTVDNNFGSDKDAVKQTILEHEAIFKNQLYELHRLYRIQRDLMDEIKRKELSRGDRAPIETSFSSSFRPSPLPAEDVRKWHMPNFPLVNPLSSHSPMSSKKAGSSLVVSIPFQSGDSSKDVELLDVRPIKTRRTMIDLTLPADEYVDTKEAGKVRGDSLRGTSSHFANGSLKVEPQNCLADLNEPIEVQETNASVYGYSLGRSSGHERAQGNGLFEGNTVEALGLSKEMPLQPPRQTRGELLKYSEDTANSRGWNPRVLGAGDQSSHKSASPFLQTDKLIHSAESIKADFWRERGAIDLEVTARHRDIYLDSHGESSVASNNLSSRQSNLTESIRPLSQWLPSWESPASGLGQKLSGSRTSPYLKSSETLSNGGLATAPRFGFQGDRGRPECSSRAILGYKTGSPNQNGFYHGSASVSYCNSGNQDVGSDQFKNHGAANFFPNSNKLSNNIMKGGIVLSNSSYGDMVFKRGLETLEVEKCKEKSASLPWLRHKPVLKTEITDAKSDYSKDVSDPSLGHSGIKSKSERVPNGFWPQSLNSVSCSNNIEDWRTGISHCPPDPTGLKRYSSADRNDRFDREENKLKNRVLDINLPCDATDLASDETFAEAPSIGKRKETKAASSRPLIDLNVSINDDDGSLPLHSPRAKGKLTMVIDLEAPPDLVNEEDHILAETLQEIAHKEPLKFSEHEGLQHSQDQLMKTVAEAIVAMSSSCVGAAVRSFEASDPDVLGWFVETIIHSCGEVADNKLETSGRGKGKEKKKKSSCEEMDYFEAMTLSLKELTEDEYFPPPLVPENLNLDEPGPAPVLTRPRRGNARRGRQRRDFQRDILPGLSSLSRHEVTEDLQTFGGLMRATGHNWNLGLTRRSAGRGGSTRGRRRAAASRSPPYVPPTTPFPSTGFQPSNNNAEAALEDRSLTGWGRMTRRPRRQRSRQSAAFT